MTAVEIRGALLELGLEEDIWLHELNPWDKIGTVCLQSTYHVYLDRFFDYKFNSETETLDIAVLDDDRSIKRSIDYSNIVCFNGIYRFERGVPHIKSFR